MSAYRAAAALGLGLCVAGSLSLYGQQDWPGYGGPDGTHYSSLAQLNRAPAIEKREPQLHDLRESGSIEQDSDKVLFLHPKDPGPGIPQDAPTDVKLIVAKQRNGKKRRWVDMRFLEQYCRFEEM